MLLLLLYILRQGSHRPLEDPLLFYLDRESEKVEKHSILEQALMLMYWRHKSVVVELSSQQIRY
jgi:hypothetical protein